MNLYSALKPPKGQTLGHLCALLSLLGLIFILFAPFGFANKPLVEEWSFIDAFRHGQGFFYVRPLDSLRPLVASWVYLGYILDPRMFNGFTIVLFLLLYLKAVTVYALALSLTDKAALSLLIAALFVVFPADTGVFQYRALSLHGSSWLYFVALLAFVRLALRKTVDAGWLLVMLVAQVWGLLTYNGGYPLVLVTPAILFWLKRPPRSQAGRIVIAWYVGMLLAIILTGILASGAPRHYESGAVTFPDFPVALMALQLMLSRQFITGWQEALVALGENRLWLVAAGITSLLWVWTASQALRPLESRKIPKLLLLGFLIIGLGYLPYLFTIYRLSDWRVAYYSTLGGTLVTVSLLSLIRQRQVFAVASGVLLLLGIVHAYQQTTSYVQISDRLQSLFGATIAQVPLNGRGTVFVYTNSPAPANCHEWMVDFHGYLGDGLRAAYADNDAVNAFILNSAHQPTLWIGSQGAILRYQPGMGYTLVATVADQLPILTAVPVVSALFPTLYGC